MKYLSRIFSVSDRELMSRGLPTRKELNPDGCLDGNYAEKNFFGKTLEDAEDLLSDGSDYYYCDFMWMGKKAFSFYIPAAMKYLKSDDSKYDADVVNQLYGIINLRVESNNIELDGCITTLKEICDYVLNNYNKFDVCEIYDEYDASEKRKLNLKERYERLRTRLSRVR